MRLLPLLAALLTPLLFFVDTRDQFELPKLTFLAVTGSLALGLAFLLRGIPRLRPLSIALLVLFAVQGLASLPGISLSWRTSLLGDYDNFAGLLSSLYYLAWFFALSAILTERLIEKTLFFAVLAAVLSSLYALGQHLGFDFVQWNPESVIGNREFAALGNPNFLAAYLAMSLPCVVLIGGRHAFSNHPSPSGKGYVFFGVMAILGMAFLLSGTSGGAVFLGQDPSNPPVGTAILFGLPFFGAALVRFGHLGSWLPLTLTTVLLSLGLVRTGSRGGWLGACAGLGCIVIVMLMDGGLRSRFQAWFRNIPKAVPIGLSATVLGLGLFLGTPLRQLPFLAPLHSWFSNNLNTAFFQRLVDTVLHFGQNVGTSRLHIWKPGLKIVRENPFFGVGLDNFKIAFPQYAGYEFGKIDGIFVSSRTAHNELLQSAATTGLLGLAAYLAVLCLFVWTWGRSRRSAGTGNRWLLAGLLASAAAYHVQNLFSFGVSSINFLWIVILAGTASLHRAAPDASPAPAAPRFPTAVRTTVLLLVLAFSVPALVRFASDVAFGRGSSALEYLKDRGDRLSPNQRNLYADYGIMMNRRAVELLPWEVKYRLYWALAYERKADTDPVAAQTWYEEALRNYELAISMSPYNSYYYNNQARIAWALYRLTRDPADLAMAERAGEKAVELAPGSPFFKVQWAFILQKTGQKQKADQVFREAFEMSPAFSCKALSQLAADEFRKGDEPFAMELLEKAVGGDTCCAEAYYTRAMILTKKGLVRAALRDYEHARSFGTREEPVR